MFFVVQTRKSNKAKPCLTVVPSKWVKKNIVYWPPKNLITLSKNKESLPDESTWKQQICKVVAKAAAYEQAEDALQKFETITDSEDAMQTTMGTRLHPAKKKPKFESRSYQLAPSMPKQPATSQVIEDSGNMSSSVLINTVDSRLTSTDVTVSNEKHLHAKAQESAGQNGTPMIVEQFPCSSGGSFPAVSSNSQEITQKMWNIVTSANGRQYLQIADGSYIEVVIQPSDTAAKLADNAEVMQPGISSENLPVNPSGRQAFNEIGSQPIIWTGLPSNNAAGVQPTSVQSINAAGMHSIGAATHQLINAGSETGSESGSEEGREAGSESEIAAGYQLINAELQPIVKGIEQMIQFDEADVDSVNKSETSKQLSEVIARLDRIEPVLQKIVFFMADVDRYMKSKPSDHFENSGKRKFQEDFSEFEGFFPIYTEDQLLALESTLNNQDTNNKLLHYFESVYNLNGKRDSGPFFKVLLRKILVATTIQMYSWKGQSRNNKGAEKTANKSFRDTFPTFVKFILRVVRAADYEFTEEANNEAFSVYLRNKNTEIQRLENGCGEQRVARVSRKRTPKPVESAVEDLMGPVDVDSTAAIGSCSSDKDPI